MLMESERPYIDWKRHKIHLLLNRIFTVVANLHGLAWTQSKIVMSGLLETLIVFLVFRTSPQLFQLFG